MSKNSGFDLSSFASAMAVENWDLSAFQSSSTGMDPFLTANQTTDPDALMAKQASAAPIRRRISTLADLNGFRRTASGHFQREVARTASDLEHLSTQDLWSLGQDKEGFFIQRLFDDSGAPIKG